MSQNENSPDVDNLKVTVKVGDRTTLEHMRRHFDEKGADNVKPDTFVHPTLEDDIEIDITDSVDAAKRGGTVRHVFGLRPTAGIPYALLPEEEGIAVNERVQALLKESGHRLNVTVTMYVVPMSADGTAVGANEAVPVDNDAGDAEEADDDVDDEQSDDDEDEQDAVTPDDEEDEEMGMVLVVSVVRTA